MEHKDSNKILTGKMKKLAKMLAKNYTVKIGILARKNKQVGENIDLAGIGCVQEYGAEIPVTDKMRGFFRHEFGINLKKTTTSIKIPARSWLYEPIKDANFRKMIYDYVGDQEVFEYLEEQHPEENLMRDLANMIGEVALMQIFKAFENNGINGEWPANSPLTIAQKGSSKPLVNNGDLKRSIAFEVE